MTLPDRTHSDARSQRTVAEALPHLALIFGGFNAGFLLPALTAAFLLYLEEFDGSWSGNSPLNSLPWIAIEYVVCLTLLITVMASRRRLMAQSTYPFFAGLAGSFTLLLLPYASAQYVDGWELPLLVGTHAMVVWLAWKGTQRVP